MSSGNWCICRSISVLQRQRDRDEALVTLTRAARQVEPIMKKRGWVVHQLSATDLSHTIGRCPG